MLPPPSADPTTALTVVEQTQADPFGAVAPWHTADTGAWPMTDTDTDQTQAIVQPQAFRVTPLLVMASITGLLALSAMFLKLFTIESVDFAFLNQSLDVTDAFSNFAVAVVIGAIVIIGGAALGATGRRIGTGLAGGAGLSIAGFALLGVAVVILQFDNSELAALTSGGPGQITMTREPGFWVLIVAALAGVVTFAMSLSEAGPDGRGRLAVGAGLLGAAGAIAVAVGPLIPSGGASFGVNFSNDLTPPGFLYIRLASLALIAVGGVVGFLNGRLWGIGVALGGISIALWQWFTSQTTQGDSPAAIGLFNPGATDGKPHIVTTLGLAAMVVAAVVALLMTAQSRTGEQAT